VPAPRITNALANSNLRPSCSKTPTPGNSYQDVESFTTCRLTLAAQQPLSHVLSGITLTGDP
jgi:hypothetical protein